MPAQFFLGQFAHLDKFTAPAISSAWPLTHLPSGWTQEALKEADQEKRNGVLEPPG
jgi:hypothetical protein